MFVPWRSRLPQFKRAVCPIGFALLLCQCGAVPPPGAALTTTAAPGVFAPAATTLVTTRPVVCMTPTPPAAGDLYDGAPLITNYRPSVDVAAGRIVVAFKADTTETQMNASHARAAKRGAAAALTVVRHLQYQRQTPFDVVDVSCAVSLEAALAAYSGDPLVETVYLDLVTPAA